MTLTTHIQLQRAVVTAVEENWKSYYQYSIVQCKDSPVCLYHMGGKLTLRHYDSRQLAKDFGLPNRNDLLVDMAKVYHAVQDLFESDFTCTYCRRLDSISR